MPLRFQKLSETRRSYYSWARRSPPKILMLQTCAFFSNVGNMYRRRDLWHRETCWIKLNEKFEHGQN